MPFITQLEFLRPFAGFKKKDVLYIDTHGDIQIVTQEINIQPNHKNNENYTYDIFENNNNFKKIHLKKKIDNDILDCNVIIDKTSNQYQNVLMGYVMKKSEFRENLKHYFVFGFLLSIIIALIGSLIYLIVWAVTAELKKS
jgi:hypothetical protein